MFIYCCTSLHSASLLTNSLVLCTSKSAVLSTQLVDCSYYYHLKPPYLAKVIGTEGTIWSIIVSYISTVYHFFSNLKDKTRCTNMTSSYVIRVQYCSPNHYYTIHIPEFTDQRVGFKPFIGNPYRAHSRSLTQLLLWGM